MSRKHLWIKVKQVPSLYKGYPPNTVIEYRPYTHRELKLLSDSALSDNEKFEIALEGIKSTIDRDFLYFDDVQFILVLRTLSTVQADKFKLTVEDPVSKTKEERQFALTDIEFRDIKAIDLPISYRISTDEIIKLTPPQVFRIKQLGSNKIEINSTFDLLFNYVMGTDITKVISTVNELAVYDVEELYNVVKEYLEMKPFVKSMINEKEVLTDLELDAVTPFREEKRFDASRIVFGEKVPSTDTTSG